MLIERGTFKVIRVNGAEETVAQRPTIDMVHAAIGCGCIDTVQIDRPNQTVMLVDDTGLIDGKPVNRKATMLYRAVCRPGTLGTIHGDVAICNDEDFA